MPIELRSLSNNIDELMNFYSEIPLTETELEITDSNDEFQVTTLDFVSFYTSELSRFFNPAHIPTPIEALSYLPKHISSVKFNVPYLYINPFNAKALGWFAGQSVSFIPESVSQVSFHFIGSYLNTVYSHLLDFSSVVDDFIGILRKLPTHITQLDLGNLTIKPREGKSFVEIFRSIPSSVTILHIGTLLSKDEFLSNAVGIDKIFLSSNSEEIDKIFSSIGRNITKLSLANIDFSLINKNILPILFRRLPDDLIYLGLGKNNLGRVNSNKLIKLFSGLPKNISMLGLSNNNLIHLGPTNLENVFSSLPSTISDIDLGENNLLLMPDDELITALFGLPATVKSIRLCERDLKGMSGAQLAIKLACLPWHIETFSMSDSNLCGLSISEFTNALSGLPKTISTLDLSGLELWNKPPEEVETLLSKIPPNITTLRLKRNKLSSLSLTTLTQILLKLPQTVTSLDLSENGFDRIMTTQLNKGMDAIPGTVKRLILDDKPIAVKNDGTLILKPSNFSYGLFKINGTMKHQKQFSDIQLAMMQLMGKGNLNLDVMLHMLSFLMIIPNLEIKGMINKLETSILPIKLPTEITPYVEHQCLSIIEQRIHSMTKERLDLSRCGLNRPIRETLKSIFKTLPESTVSLSLRGNGFSLKEESVDNLIDAFRHLRKNITYIDLSENGFETYSAEELERLFANLPATVQLVSLNNEKPVSPAQQIAMRKWPAAYQRLTAETNNIMQKARILLNNYTANDSLALRLLQGHWNRSYTDQIARLVRQIDTGLITNLNDLLFEVEKIDMPYESKSLTRRLAFLSIQAQEPTTETIEFGNTI